MNSKICNAEDFEKQWFLDIFPHFKENFRYHRKVWEIVSIASFLNSNKVLVPDKMGLGFACGQEKIPSLIAAIGGKALATDRDPKEDDNWAKANQQSIDKSSLYMPEVVDYETFDSSIDFQFMNMNHIPEECTGKYDYTWSCCAMEHLGSIQHGIDFFINSLKCLKPGGIAIHTTEYNLSSNNNTLETPGTSIFRRKDIDKLVEDVYKSGYTMIIDESTFQRGDHRYNKYVDSTYLYCEPSVHLNLRLAGYDVTAIRLIAIV